MTTGTCNRCGSEWTDISWEIHGVQVCEKCARTMFQATLDDPRTVNPYLIQGHMPPGHYMWRGMPVIVEYED